MLSTEYSLLSQILIYTIGGTLFVSLALFVSRILRPNRPGVEKLSSYESGEIAQGSARVQFNLRFYVLALVFILFEVEVVFLFPWATIFADTELNTQTQGAWGWYTFVEMLVFIGVLALGLAYAWRMGHLDWIKSKPQQNEIQSPIPDSLYQALNEKYKNQKSVKG